jgi:toxin secretion/phage lysis holin
MMAWSDHFMLFVTGWVAALPMLGILILLMGLDVLTGLIAACITRQLSSSASWVGMLKKVMMLALIAAGVCMEQLYGEVPWSHLVSMLFCVTELISITENAAKAGIPLPRQLTDFLLKLKEDPHTTAGPAAIDPLAALRGRAQAPHDARGPSPTPP